MPVLELALPFHIRSGNEFKRCHWAREMRYATRCHEAVAAACLKRGIQRARECPRFFALIEITSYRRYACDQGNLVDGAKYILDALTWRSERGWGIVADDSPAWCEDRYYQVIDRRQAARTGTRIEIWKLVEKG